MTALGCCRQIEPEEIDALKQRLGQTLELTVAKKKKILLARMEMQKMQGSREVSRASFGAHFSFAPLKFVKSLG